MKIFRYLFPLHFYSRYISISSTSCCVKITEIKKRKETYLTVSFSLACNILMIKVVKTIIPDRTDTVIYPFRYSGASICCHTINGNQAWNTYAISFIIPITRARSSLSDAQISCAQLRLCKMNGLALKK